MKEYITLNLSEESARAFVDDLANYDYYGLTDNRFRIEHGTPETVFLINGHKLTTKSDQIGHLIIDGRYVPAAAHITVVSDGVEYAALDYVLKNLGFCK